MFMPAVWIGKFSAICSLMVFEGQAINLKLYNEFVIVSVSQWEHSAKNDWGMEFFFNDRTTFIRDARSSEMRREQRCEENRDAKRTEMRREQRCEENRSRERKRERGERGEVAARSAAPAGARTSGRCCPPGGGGVVIPFSFGGVTLPWANSPSDCAFPGLFWAYFEIAQK